MSAMGSVIIVREFPPVELPARLDDTRDFAGQSELPEADAAQIELAQIAARPAAAEAAVSLAAAQFRCLGGLRFGEPQILDDLGSGSHVFFLIHSYCRNGMPRCFKSARPSASVLAVVVMQTFIPRALSTLL